MLDDILKQIQDLKHKKADINSQIIKLSDQAGVLMKQALHGDRKPRKTSKQPALPLNGGKNG
jgi:uncharacterized coiled-coil DUF342 family protein